jgi:hypothetical protein
MRGDGGRPSEGEEGPHARRSRRGEWEGTAGEEERLEKGKERNPRKRKERGAEEGLHFAVRDAATAGV